MGDSETGIKQLQYLEQRLGKIHAKQRLGIENETRQKVFGNGLNFFHPENWFSFHTVIRTILKVTGTYWIGRRNVLAHQIIENTFYFQHLPKAFEGYTILHLSDLHTDMNEEATRVLAERLKMIDYDICVLTGDYRAATSGSIDRSMQGMRLITTQLKQPVYGVLGNHDSIRMVPVLEDMGIHILLNEHVTLEKEGERIYLAGIDDAHYYRVDNIAGAREQIPEQAVSILLSHTPEVYRQAAHAGFDAFLCGHTHGGQICLPGGFPLTLDAKCPRYMGAGEWQYADMQGYTSRGAGTSVVDVRFNCAPEISIHRLTASMPSVAE